MGKYKDGGRSIPISSIPVEELGDAFKEWANGNEAMEELLRACYENGLETIGNHFGPMSYLEFFVNDSHRVIKSIFNYMQDINGANVMIVPDGGNPIGNETIFEKPDMSVSFGHIEKKEELEEMLRGMTAVINDSSSKREIGETAFDPMLDIHNFFAEKGSRLVISAQYANGQYSFSINTRYPIQVREPIKNRIEYFEQLFEKAGLSYEKIEDRYGSDIHNWEMVSDTKEEFRKKLIKAEEIIEANWTYEKPTQIEEWMSLNEKAKIKIEQLGKTPESMAKFKEWLEEEEKKEIIQSIEMKEVVSNAIESGTTTEQVQEADNVERIEIQEQELEGETKDD